MGPWETCEAGPFEWRQILSEGCEAEDFRGVVGIVKAAPAVSGAESTMHEGWMHG